MSAKLSYDRKKLQVVNLKVAPPSQKAARFCAPEGESHAIALLKRTSSGCEVLIEHNVVISQHQLLLINIDGDRGSIGSRGRVSAVIWQLDSQRGGKEEACRRAAPASGVLERVADVGTKGEIA